jgi:hypothetical protein
MSKHIAVYVRVSSPQDTASQEPDPKRWAEGQDTPVVWYRDKFTGKVMDRSGWNKLMQSVEARKVSAIVVWRLPMAPRRTNPVLRGAERSQPRLAPNDPMANWTTHVGRIPHTDPRPWPGEGVHGTSDATAPNEPNGARAT